MFNVVQGHRTRRNGAMRTHGITRRDFSVGVASLFPVLTAASAKGGWDPAISNNAEAIHQVIALKAPPKRIYEVLLDAEQFSKMSGGLGTEINPEVGGAFSLFSSQIKGR